MSFRIFRTVLQQFGQSANKLEVRCSRTTSCRPFATTPFVSNSSDDSLTEAPIKLDALAESLASKGYLRAQKPYQPPTNVRQKINTLLAELKTPTTGNLTPADKFAVLNACFASFQHSVPNSHLFEVKNIDDIVRFYETPVNTTLPLDAMRTMDLPENLHIQHDYVRFTGDPNDKFGGKTAFPRSSTLVTGLKYRKKYQGYTAKRSWP